VEQLSPALTFLVEYLSLPDAVGDKDATWEMFQLQRLNTSCRFLIGLKSRQVGSSWLDAAEAVAYSILEPRSTSIFVSINQDEAAEKIRYARFIYEALDKDVRPKLVTDNALELTLPTGSRLISHPCRPVRGKAKARVYLDEFAHYPKDKIIYESTLPVISKGGVIRINSSPFGATGMFWEIFTQSTRPYPGYRRMSVPWWTTRAMCKDVPTAILVAPGMLTSERVHKFGSERLIDIYENMPEESFRQEYECEYVDEAVSWITWDDIKRNQMMAADGKLEYWYAKATGDSAESFDHAMNMLDEVAKSVVSKHIEDAFSAGVDVGRRKDTSELILLGRPTTTQLPYRVGITLDRMPFEKQMALVSKAIDILPITKLLIDQTGMGIKMAEDLTTRHRSKVEGVDFTNAAKETWAVDVKVKMEKGELPIPLHRDLAYQIHSIRKKVTDSKHTSFDTDGTETHHADMFWALALAVSAANQRRTVRMPHA
jgi:phage FluMu gp28-like protein